MNAFAAGGLDTIRRAIEEHVARGYAPGAVGLVERAGETHLFAVGAPAFEGHQPIRPDAIFRIASMTKPITAAAAMILIEEGKLALDEPVERLLPELAERRVLKRVDAALDDTVPADRPITVEDLLSFRLGLGLVFAPPGAYPILGRIAELGLVGFGPPDPRAPLGPDEWMRRLGTLPLMAQPGQEWLYTAGSNVLGMLVSRAAGMGLEAVFRSRIFAPLGMNDTGFSVPPADRARLTTAYVGRGEQVVAYDTPGDSGWTEPPAFPAGDAGLVSTAADFAAFARMLLTGGSHNGRRILAPESIKAMTSDQLTAEQRQRGRPILGRRGWGYGLGVWTEPDPDGPAPGAIGWDGGLGTSWVSDRATGLTAILLTQRMFDNPMLPGIHQSFRRAAFAALA